MKYSVTDIGSNSMRLTVYEVENGAFEVLFKEKIIAGLAEYVENGCLTEEGIQCAYNGLLEFKNTLELLGLRDSVSVFATASLRNIANTDEAVRKITAATGFYIEVLPGEEEAWLGYVGAMQELDIDSGVIVDIGGASTEIVSFAGKEHCLSGSYQVGSLKLFHDCVKKILPGDGSVKRIKAAITEALPDEEFAAFGRQKQIACVGGTARSLLRIAQKICDMPEGGNTITEEQMGELHELFFGDPKRASDVILKINPERIHTIIPGFMILEHIMDKLGAEKITVSKYGVREGYLCQKILKRK